MGGWSFKLIRVAGIAVYVHWTFLLLLAVIAGSELISSGDTPMADRLAAAASAALFILSVFACVILHEFGHAMAARMYGIKTKDIYVLPIGGVARLERMPRSPLQEFVVAIAGPAVNIAIAIILIAILGISIFADVVIDGSNGNAPANGGGGGSGGGIGQVLSHGLLGQLLIANFLLVVFNMIPAFPMDGGRILRAFLASLMPYEKATRAAARVGQAVAVAMACFAIFGGQPMLLFVAIFVFFGAQAELSSAQFHARLEGLLVRDAMQRRFVALREHDPIGSVADFVRTGAQFDFPVVRDASTVYTGAPTALSPSVLAGMIKHARLVELLASPDGAAGATPASAVMDTQIPSIEEGQTLISAVERMQTTGLSTLPVTVSDGPDRRLIGLLTAQSIGAAIEWQRSRRATPHTPTTSPMPGR